MKYLITGAHGQLGRELQALLTDQGLDFVAYDAQTLDITNRQAVFEAVQAQAPDVIFDAAAYTKVDLAEDTGKEQNWAVNVDGTANLAQAAKAFSAKLLYISTDYVFDGQKETAYLETDPLNPKNEYGRAKAAGEKAVLASLAEAYIVRTSWVYGEYGNNFVYTMQRLAKTHPTLTVVNDQIGRPTWTKSLAQFMQYLVDSDQEPGVYHFSNDGIASWYQFAEEILQNTKVQVTPISSEEFPQKAYRPRHSILDLSKSKATGFKIPTWQEALKMSGMIDK